MIYSMEASNTEFHAHQFKPVLKMLGSPTGGLLIADEVGLGKTIEAALVWTELKARFEYNRLLIVCPKVLCTKWEAELRVKFGIDARIVDAAGVLEVLQDPLRRQRGFALVCGLQSIQPSKGWDIPGSTTYDRASSELARFLDEAREDEPQIDLLVIDEAHHLRNPETQRNLFGRLIRATSNHKVFLSATPIQLRNRDLFSLLALLDPDTFQNPGDLEMIVDANRPIIAALDQVFRGAPRTTVTDLIRAAANHPLLSGSEQIRQILETLSSGEGDWTFDTRAQLAARLENANLLASLVTRTRRRDVQEFRIERQVAVHRADLTGIERSVYDALTDAVLDYALINGIGSGFLLSTAQRMLASSLPATVAHWRRSGGDSGDEDGEIDFVERDPPGDLVNCLSKACADLPATGILEAEDSKFHMLFDVLNNYLNTQPSERVIVFSTYRITLEYLMRRLTERNVHSELIHGGVEDRDESIRRFAEEGGPRVLLSSEIGSEGLDLQFCRAIINYDLPWNPMRIEQRIGRIDRLGQDAKVVSIISLLGRDTIDDRIYTRLYQRLDLIKQALGDFEAVLGDEIRRLSMDLLIGKLTPEQQDARIDQARQAIANKKAIAETIEKEAGALIAHGDTILRHIRDARENNRWVTPDDLFRYIRDSLQEHYPGSSVRMVNDDGLAEMSLIASARVSFSEWLNNGRYPSGSRIERDSGPIAIRLGPKRGISDRGRKVESVGQAHPFIRFLASRNADSKTQSLRPAVAAIVSGAAVEIEPGKYLVLIERWSFNGQLGAEKLVFAGLNIETGSVIPSNLAEAIASRAMDGTYWIDAAASIDLKRTIAFANDNLLSLLDAQFFEEERARMAEQKDRADIQRTNLERRYREEAGRLRELIERQQRNARVRGSVINANEGKLRKLKERTDERKKAIEASVNLTGQQETLAAILAWVTP